MIFGEMRACQASLRLLFDRHRRKARRPPAPAAHCNTAKIKFDRNVSIYLNTRPFFVEKLL